MKAYHSLLTDLQSLSDEEFGTFMRGCLRYSETGEIPVFGDRLLDALFVTQRRLIDEADAEYEAIREKNRENIMKRWHGEPIQENTPVYDRIQAYTIDTKTKTRTKTKTIPSKEGRFTPPTAEQVAEYCKERGNGIDPERFVNFYQQKNWMVGKNKMVDWRAAVRNWEARDKAEHPKTEQKTQYKNEELEKLEVDLERGDFSW